MHRTINHGIYALGPPERDQPMPRKLSKAFFNRSVHAVAPDLIGATLLFKGVGGMIAEVEAYHHTDPASHSYGGPDRPQRASCLGRPAMSTSTGPTASTGA